MHFPLWMQPKTMQRFKRQIHSALSQASLRRGLWRKTVLADHNDMNSIVLNKPTLGLLVVGLIVGLFPLALRVARPFATFPWNPKIDARILLVWPNHIDLVPVNTMSTFSPRSANAGYTFLVPKERLAWVTEQLKKYPTPTRGTSWQMRIRSIGESRQEIELELLGDGIYGIEYDASDEKVVPLKTRLAGPGFVFIVAGIDVLGSGILLLILLFIVRLLRSRAGGPF